MQSKKKWRECNFDGSTNSGNKCKRSEKSVKLEIFSVRNKHFFLDASYPQASFRIAFFCFSRIIWVQRKFIRLVLRNGGSTTSRGKALSLSFLCVFGSLLRTERLTRDFGEMQWRSVGWRRSSRPRGGKATWSLDGPQINHPDATTYVLLQVQTNLLGNKKFKPGVVKAYSKKSVLATWVFFTVVKRNR